MFERQKWNGECTGGLFPVCTARKEADGIMSNMKIGYWNTGSDAHLNSEESTQRNYHRKRGTLPNKINHSSGQIA